MGTPSEKQSHFRTPLNRILGTETSVRVLRVLADTQTPLSKPEVARRAALNPSGVRRTLDDLIECGIVEAVGAGSQRPVRLRRSYPLAQPLEQLFRAERNRVDEFYRALRSSVVERSDQVRAAWIQGPLASGQDELGDPVVIGVLASSDVLGEVTSELTHALTPVGGRHEVPIEVKGYAIPDLLALPESEVQKLNETLPLLGAPPESYLEEEAEPEEPDRSSRAHEELDRRALEYGRAVANRLAQDPTLLERARRFIDRRIDRASASERDELREWALLLESMSVPRLRELLVSESERAERLRQTLPFLEVLTDEERDEIRSRIGSSDNE